MAHFKCLTVPVSKILAYRLDTALPKTRPSYSIPVKCIILLMYFCVSAIDPYIHNYVFDSIEKGVFSQKKTSIDLCCL